MLVETFVHCDMFEFLIHTVFDCAGIWILWLKWGYISLYEFLLYSEGTLNVMDLVFESSETETDKDLHHIHFERSRGRIPRVMASVRSCRVCNVRDGFLVFRCTCWWELKDVLKAVDFTHSKSFWCVQHVQIHSFKDARFWFSLIFYE